MKKLIFLLIFLPCIVYSQNYLKVYPDEHTEKLIDGVTTFCYLFNLNPDYSSFSNYKNCKITLNIVDNKDAPILDKNIVRAFTGHEGKYLEDEQHVSDKDGYTELYTSTNNLLGGLYIFVATQLEIDYGVVLKNVNMEYNGDRYP